MVMARLESKKPPENNQHKAKTKDVRGYRWDYLDLVTQEKSSGKAEIVSLYSGFGADEVPELRGPVAGFLDMLGQRGWELVSVMQIGDDRFRYIFKMLIDKA